MFASKDGEEGTLKGEKRKQQVEVAMMKQARVKINPANFKLSVPTPSSTAVSVVRKKGDVEKHSINIDDSTTTAAAAEPQNALSMLADY